MIMLVEEIIHTCAKKVDHYNMCKKRAMNSGYWSKKLTILTCVKKSNVTISNVGRWIS
jgi:hypothetical protein